ncbi:hypothetical protein H206_06173 [Candidatus Electrothrix aarhusensis]|uniref:Uncharacterized protein n=1 Tax=Candidatus Electrothrix aarhusensis TaxID=1859131 RepID=A0A3S3QTX1_9BACT|nr:hypothetical protein H206_06173 [Candidatus Electrothrix aarhusensis]
MLNKKGPPTYASDPFLFMVNLPGTCLARDPVFYI